MRWPDAAPASAERRVVVPKGGCELTVAARDVNDQSALDTGSFQNGLRPIGLRFLGGEEALSREKECEQDEMDAIGAVRYEHWI